MLLSIKKNVLFLISALGHFPGSSFFIRKFLSKYPDYSTEACDICIEGFPRSGNTYFYAAFRRWNLGVKVAHHTHLASSAIFSIKQHKPTVILIRHPADAVASAMAWEGKLRAGIALASYTLFYRCLWKYRHDVVAVTFEQAIDHTSATVSRINNRFQSDYQYRDLTDKEKAAIRQSLKQSDLKKLRTPTSATLPTAEKAAIKAALLPVIERSCLYSPAVRTYDRFVQLSLR